MRCSALTSPHSGSPAEIPTGRLWTHCNNSCAAYSEPLNISMGALSLILRCHPPNSPCSKILHIKSLTNNSQSLLTLILWAIYNFMKKRGKKKWITTRSSWMDSIWCVVFWKVAHLHTQLWMFSHISASFSAMVMCLPFYLKLIFTFILFPSIKKSLCIHSYRF